MRRIISLRDDQQLFKAKCVLALNLVERDFKLRERRDELLYAIASKNIGGVVNDADKVNAEVLYDLGITRSNFDWILHGLKKDGLLVRRGSSYFVHPILVNGSDDTPDDVLVRLKPKGDCDKATKELKEDT